MKDFAIISGIVVLYLLIAHAVLSCSVPSTLRDAGDWNPGCTQRCTEWFFDLSDKPMPKDCDCREKREP